MIELYLISEGIEHPHDADKINLPDLGGALLGLTLAKGIDQYKTCKGCAFRKGTCANQSIITTMDAQNQIDNLEPFMCHLDDDDMAVYRPTRKCRGWAQAVRQQSQPDHKGEQMP